MSCSFSLSWFMTGTLSHMRFWTKSPRLLQTGSIWPGPKKSWSVRETANIERPTWLCGTCSIWNREFISPFLQFIWTCFIIKWFSFFHAKIFCFVLPESGRICKFLWLLCKQFVCLRVCISCLYYRSRCKQDVLNVCHTKHAAWICVSLCVACLSQCES